MKHQQIAENWKQDDDVLGYMVQFCAYGHSQQWAGQIKTHAEFKRYYPTDALVTGYDIIFFWVSRMIFQGIEFTGRTSI